MKQPRKRIGQTSFNESQVVDKLQELYPELSREQIWEVYKRQSLNIKNARTMLNLLTHE